MVLVGVEDVEGPEAIAVTESAVSACSIKFAVPPAAG